MLDKVMSILAPHHCCGCDKIGCLLCGNCKYNIVSESEMVCVICRRPTRKIWLCSECRAPYEWAWVVGKRDGVLQRLIGLYKFERAKAACQPLAELLADSLPRLPENVVVVPIPTTPSRIRERGYDHMLLIAKYFAKIRNSRYEQILGRKNNTKQRQASALKREAQAKQAFEVVREIDETAIYLLVDDVITTGATIKYAAKALRKAGAKHVWVAAISRQD